MVYPFDEEKLGIFNHRRRKRPNPWILIRKRILLIFLLSSPHFCLMILDLDNLTSFLMNLCSTFPEKLSHNIRNKTLNKFIIFLLDDYRIGETSHYIVVEISIFLSDMSEIKDSFILLCSTLIKFLVDSLLKHIILWQAYLESY